MRKFLVILLLPALILSLFCSCRKEKEPGNRVPVIPDLSGYTVIVPSNVGDELNSAVQTFLKKMNETYGVNLRAHDDFIIEEMGIVEVEKEILIGNTNRQESKDCGNLKYHDYDVTSKGTKLVICGGSDEAVIEGLSRFSEAYLAKDHSGGLSLYEDDLISYRHAYRMNSLQVCGADISNWQIVYRGGSPYLMDAAEKLSDAICEAVGIKPDVVSDGKYRAEKDRREILVGKTNRGSADGAATIAGNTAIIAEAGVNIQICGTDDGSSVRAVNAFIKEYLAGSGEIALSFKQDKIFDLPEQVEHSVMTFNLLATDIPKREKLVAEAILSHLPDSVGVQECSEEWMNSLQNSLSEKYAWVGSMNSSRQRWYNAIFYRKDKLKVIESGTYWLSDTPNEYSKYLESDQFRIVTFAVFEDLATGERYVHYNTHLDINSKASSKQYTVLNELTKQFDYPCVITGDFNMTPTWPLYSTVTKTWLDSRSVAEKTTGDWTCDGKILDYCFHSSSIISTQVFVVNDPYVDKVSYNSGQTKGQDYYLSDHYPVIVKFYISD